MKRKTYPTDFKEQALSKVRERGSKTLLDVAGDLNLSLGTLKSWLKESGNTISPGITHSPNDKRHDGACSDSMRQPTACEMQFIDEILKLDPRSAYPYMSTSEYARMMEERTAKNKEDPKLSSGELR